MPDTTKLLGKLRYGEAVMDVAADGPMEFPGEGWVTARRVAVTGIASLLLLAASLQWAHHWGPMADSIVAAWAVATLGALAGAIIVRRRHPKRSEAPERLVRFHRSRRRLANAGMAFAMVSVLALILAAAAFALGYGDSVPSCGGG